MIWDTGAQVNIITNSVVKELKLVRSAAKVGIKGIDGKAARTKGEVQLELWHGQLGQTITTKRFVIIMNLIPDHPQRSFQPGEFSDTVKQDLADPRYFEQGSIEGVIGTEIAAAHIKPGMERSSTGLLAQSTSLGWIISGEGGFASPEEEPRTIGVVVKEEIRSLIQRLWEVEEMEERPISMEDQYCEDNFRETVIKENNRYSVTIPLRPEAELGESKAMAVRRFFSQESKFKRDPEYRQKYVEFMEEYEKMGHMMQATPVVQGELHNYIPHHAVAVDRKFRVVFDGSAKTSNGNSLNDIQYIGPRLQKDLLDIIIKFRTGRIAISADICKMFRQVRIQPIHWNLQRIVWRADPNEPLRDYWLTVVTYGLASSPYLAVKALNQCAVEAVKKKPKAAQVVNEDFYMDDMLASVESEGEAMELKKDVTKILRGGGFELTKWRSNCLKVMEEEMEAKVVELQNNTSVLGVIWDFVEDEFRFKVQERDQPNLMTKRYITSEAARVFDPQGWVTPVTMKAKLFIQELWRMGSSWDESLPTSLRQEWKIFYDELKFINELRIPRWLETSASRRMQIHIFSDASTKAYGAVVYARVCVGDQWSAKLLCSRSRVAPIKLVTIPRLELCAVELGTKLIPRLMETPMFKEANIYIWTDSEIVLYWLRKPVNELRTFVANRVSRILRGTIVEQFRHIKSENNPADLISRGIKAENLINNKLWWQGPAMLEGTREEWPDWTPRRIDLETHSQVRTECRERSTEVSNVFMTVRLEEDETKSLLEKVSSIESVCRITAYVIRFCRQCFAPIYKRRGNDKDTRGGLLNTPEVLQLPGNGNEIIIKIKEVEIPVKKLTIEEIDNGLNYWLIASQKQSFPEEYKAIQNGKAISRSSRLWMLTPWMDEKGLVRITGRLGNAQLSVEQRRPIVLDPGALISRRIAERAHKELCHGGAQLCTQYLRKKYWILRSRVLIRGMIHKCVTCCRHRQQAAQQLMADLPGYRLSPTPAFYHCGVDYAGPVQLKQSRNVTVKGYIAVFVCMVYKAVHLELVSKMDAHSFVASLTRFINLRAGAVHHMYSDNGTNFVGANRILREAFELWQNSAVAEHLQSHSIQWHYNPPNAPHHGGLWEAAVKSMKHHLKRVGGAQLYTYEELATLLAKIAACLNSRPLTPISDDPTDLSVLSPGHFLTGQPIISPYETLLVEVPMNRLSAWQKIQQLQQQFWNRWTQEYISEQQRRNKWAEVERELKIGDLVFIKNEITPPSRWMMARIIEVYPGRDGKIRTCKVKTEKGELVRPITQLCLLPVD